MRKFHWHFLSYNVSHLITALFTAVFIFCACPSYAEQFPKDGSQKLSTILQTEAFNPREVPKTFKEQAMEYLRAYVIKYMERIGDWLNDFVPAVDKDSWLAGFFRTIAEYLRTFFGFIGEVSEWIFWIGLVLILLVGAYYALRYFGFFLVKKAKQLSTDSYVEIRPKLTLGEILALQSPTELLVAIRRYLRERIQRERKIPLSATDREVVQRVVEAEPGLTIFKEVAHHFEKVSFGKASIDETLVRGLAERLPRLVHEEGAP